MGAISVERTALATNNNNSALTERCYGGFIKRLMCVRVCVGVLAWASAGPVMCVRASSKTIRRRMKNIRIEDDAVGMALTMSSDHLAYVVLISDVQIMHVDS